MPAEHLPVFALDNDSIVEIKGDPVGLHKAVELIATHLRNFLVDHRAVGAIRAEVSNMVTFVKKRKGGVLSLIHCYKVVYSFYSDAKVKYSSKPKYASTPIRLKLSQCRLLNISHLHVNVKITTLLQTCLLWTSHLILATSLWKRCICWGSHDELSSTTINGHKGFLRSSFLSVFSVLLSMMIT